MYHVTQYVYVFEKLKIPKTTNGLESFFGHLKGNLNVHMGLTKERRKKFLQWYLYYKNKSDERLFIHTVHPIISKRKGREKLTLKLSF